MNARNRQILLSSLPEGKLSNDDFEMVDADVPAAAEGELLVRTRIISLDPANRAWMQGRTYRAQLAPGSVMAGLAISEVVQSRARGFAPGDIVLADSGWQDYAAITASEAIKQARVDELSHLLSAFGSSALTAHVGLHAVGGLRAGETVVVSGAGGSVGTSVGQIARIRGARVIGIAGSDEKCRWLIDDLGFDGALNYRAGSIGDQLRAKVPEGIDLYFDNVAGEILARCLFAMKIHGRIVCCGAVSQYDGPKPEHGPRGVPGTLIAKRLTMRGFILSDYKEERDAALEDLRSWVAVRAFRPVEDILDGLESAPAGLIGQLAGENRGKRMVRVS